MKRAEYTKLILPKTHSVTVTTKMILQHEVMNKVKVCDRVSRIFLCWEIRTLAAILEKFCHICRIYFDMSSS